MHKKKYKVVMIGGYGSRDIGDEAMPHADRLNMKRLMDGNLEIVMLSHDPQYTASFHQERSVYDVGGIATGSDSTALEKMQGWAAHFIFLFGALAQKVKIRLSLWRSAREALDELASADLLFNVGGGNLNSLITEEFYKKCALYLAAWLLRRPIIISGQTIGPFTRRADKWYARVALNRAHMITFRDKDTSYKRLREIGVVKPVMLDAADDAMTIPSLSEEESLSILYRETGWNREALAGRLLVAMNLKGSLKLFKGFHRGKDLDREIALMARIADALIRNYHAHIFFLPTDYNRSVDDREVHREIIAKMDLSDDARCIGEEHSDARLKGLVGLADIAIGVRYHFLVFAASQGIPFLGIASGTYQQTKIKGLADLCGLPQCYFEKDMEFTSFLDVWPRVASLLEASNEIRSVLARILPSLKNRSWTGVKEAVRLLKAKR